MQLIKQKVCPDCLSMNVQPDCRCMYMEYKPIMLEFEKCECCNHIKDEPTDTEFNRNQLEMLRNETESRFK